MNFEELTKLNVNEHVEKKKTGSTELSYLSWAWAWEYFKKVYPNAKYEIKKFANEDGVLLPYMYDGLTGYMVMTSVTVGEETHEMWLPVMDSANKAMKSIAYKYEVNEYAYGKKTGNMIEKTVESASMFDVNKTIMRCLVKNLAMFGLGLYIYAGEDLPEQDKPELPTELVKAIKEDIKTIDELKECYNINKGMFDGVLNKEFNELISSRKKELENANS